MDDLKQQVATELGYKIISIPIPGEPVERTDNYRHYLVLPNDDRRMQFSSIQAILEWLPDWAHSVDAVLRLPLPPGAEWLLTQNNGEWYAELCGVPGGTELGTASNLAEAMCQAWLDCRRYARVNSERS